MKRIAHLEHGLSFLDLSYATEVTDQGLAYFKDKSFPITKLIVNGLTGISSLGLSDLITSCKEYLNIFEGGLMD